METLSLVYLPSAIALGALHALEPGHAKTLTAAYLIGVKGTRRDAILLGLAVAFTHSIVVIALSVGALWIGRQSFTDDALYWLQLSSALIVIVLGGWMLWHRWPGSAPHLHAPEPVSVAGRNVRGTLAIANLQQGERFRLALEAAGNIGPLLVRIHRGASIEAVPLTEREPGVWISDAAPAEPHGFQAELVCRVGEEEEAIPFEMHEPAHSHDHADCSDDEHARAHAAQLPSYVRDGVRPTTMQIFAFGAAGGLIPCPASITVMLLALSINQLALGVLAVLGFSAGLAVTLVGIGLAVVAGLQRLSRSSRFASVGRYAPQISAAMVVLSGLVALLFVHHGG